MPEVVVNGAVIKCAMALPPGIATLITSPQTVNHTWQGRALATINDNKPMQNIPSFGMCNSTANPAVISATAAASGVHTPAPCVPQVTAPWTPGSTIASFQDVPLLHKGCMAMCQWGGQISVQDPGQVHMTTT